MNHYGEIYVRGEVIRFFYGHCYEKNPDFWRQEIKETQNYQNEK